MTDKHNVYDIRTGAAVHVAPYLRRPIRSESEARAAAAARFQPLLDVLARADVPKAPALHPTFVAALAPWRPAS